MRDISITEQQGQDVLNLVRMKVRKFATSAGHRVQDTENLEGDLAHRVVTSWADFDPSRAERQTYINRVIDSGLRDWRRREKAAKRDRRRETCSLNAKVGHAAGSCERIHLVDADQHQVAFGRRRRSRGELDDLRLDLKEVLNKLSPKQRKLLSKLLREESPSAVAKQVGVHRGSVHRWLVDLRRQLQDTGLHDYLA